MCKVEGCNNKIYKKGYCCKHYTQIRRYGEISDRTRFDKNEIIIHEDFAEVILYNRNQEKIGKTLIDLDDIDIVKKHKWCLNHDYVVTTINNKNVSLHRYLMNCPSDKTVDHINHNTFDNRRSNLRICTHQQNNMNRTLPSNNTSGVVGVYWHKKSNKWMAKIKINGKSIHLGLFTDKEEAIKVRKEAEEYYFKEYRNND